MKKNKKIISMLLVLVLMFSAMEFTSLTAETPTLQQAVDNESVYDNQYDKTLVLPDVIKESDADAAEKYISREHSYEKDLNTFVFRNNDGTFTKKLYDYPVKYIDKTGETRDITTDIKKLSDGSFETAENNIVTTFSNKLSEGITLTHDEVVIKMVPAAKFTTESSAASLSSDKKTISYPYGNKTKLEYSLTYTGFKEDIVVEEYTGQTEYTFTLHTNGLFVTEIDGSFYLTDNDKNIKAVIGDIIIFTADEKNNTIGTLTAQTVKLGQIYTMTIHVDADYLKDEKTLYPIRIDPTIEIRYSNNGAGAIEDATICSSSGSNGTLGSLYIGKRETYGISRALMKFPGLNLNDVYSSSNIVSATLNLRDLMCESTEMTLYAHTFTGNTWSESSVSWTGVNANSYVSTQLDAVEMSWYNGLEQESEHYYKFDITEAVRGWKSGSYSQDKGILLKMSSTVENSTTYMHRTLGSYNRAEYKPVLEFVYRPIISTNYATTNVNEGSTKTITATTYPADATLTWSSSNTNVATVSNGVVTGISAGSTLITASITDSTGTHSVSCNLYVTIPNGVYYIQNKYSNKVADVYNNQVQTYTAVSQYTLKSLSEANIDEAINQLWKIYYLGYGYYSIRPMHCLNMLLYAEGNNIKAFNSGNVSNVNTSVSDNAKWSMTRTSVGMKIDLAYSSNKTLSIGSNTTSNVSLVVETDTGATYQRWNMQRVTTSISCGRLYDLRTNRYYKAQTNEVVRYVAPQESSSLSNLDLLGVACRSNSNTQSIQWRSSNTNIATVNSSTGEVTGVSAGTVNIYSNTYSFGYTLIVTEVPNGTYYFRNKQSKYFADIKGPTMAAGTTIHQWSFHGGNSQKWILTHLGDGYYTIRSNNSSSAYYMGVINDSTGLDVDVVLRTGSITDGMKWKFAKTTNGAYKVIPKIGEPMGYILATTTSNEANGYKLIQGAYIDNNSYRDEWELFDVVFSFVNYYDSSIDPNALAHRDIFSSMPTANDYVKTIFNRLFGVDFKTVGDPVYTDIIASGCSSPYDHCTDACGSCENHHKNIINVANRCYNYLPRDNNQIAVVWTLRYGEYCEKINGSHTLIGYGDLVSYAGVFANRPVVNFYHISGGVDFMSCVLLHEVAHVFGMSDVYDDPSHGAQPGIQCVMERLDINEFEDFYENTLDEDISPFCDSCENALMNTYIQRKYFEGN